ncbi:MAG TPA: relaxase/mobilization nuclease domain-containing protein [Ruminococcus sp.]|nr:relaxase/mobilization nuclease domain-containing protein [Ruminococcus sp.]
MATTKLFAIKTTEVKALAYIANPEKTDGGRLIFTYGCSPNPAQASRDFEAVRAGGTGLNTVLSQHFIQSFMPGEITPERALEVGKDLCEKFLKGEYQYFLAVHTDKAHTHLHVIFNNVSRENGRTFETNMNQGKLKERAWKKLIDLSDEVCRRHHLAVIDHPEQTKGKSHWEWDMNRQGLSWKAKLKYTIDQVVKASEDFDDFLRKSAEYGVLVEYNPDHKIDLKFMLAEQKERNPRAKMTRARTLGWFYETQQIKDRIAQYHGVMIYTPRTKVRVLTKKPPNKFVQDAIDRGNMKLASIAKNVIAEYGVEPEQIPTAALSEYANSRQLLSELNNMNTEIDDMKFKLKILRKYRKLKVYAEERKKLSGSAARKYRQNNSDELTEYGQIRSQVLELYPSGHIPTVENLEKKINALIQERSEKDLQFREADKRARDLADAQRTIEEYLRQERNEQQQDRKRKKNGDLE